MDGGNDPTVSVVVPLKNAEATIRGTLDALRAQDAGEPFEVLVVDDGSSDTGVRIAGAFGPPVRVLRQPPAGPAAARNLGASAARARALAFTDADCVPEPSWLRHGLAALRGSDLVQGRVLPARPRSIGPFDHTVWVESPSPLFETANLFVRRELFEGLGGFEDPLGARIGKPLGEDVWLGWRARRSGARIAFAADAVVLHAVLPRGPRAYVAERLRLVYFPALVALIPELRRELLVARLFLSRRTALFDLAVAGLAAAVVLAASGASHALLAGALAAAIPYAAAVVRESVPQRRSFPLVLAARVLADAVGLAALLAGSLRWRRVVI